jgi:hypothetical protein
MTDTFAAVQRAEQRHEEAVLQDACTLANIGVRTVQGRSRTVDTVRRRAVVAWILKRSGWKQQRIARALHRTTRQIKRLLRNM